MRAAKRRVDGLHVKPKPTEEDGLRLELNLLYKWCDGLITTKDLTEQAYYITRAGGRGVEHLTCNPNTCGHNSSRKFRTSVQIPTDFTDTLTQVKDVPIWNSDTETIDYIDYPLRLPSDVLMLDYKLYPDTYEITGVDPGDWDVPSLTEHPVTKEHGIRETIPIGFYTDKVAYTKRDSFLRYSIGCTWKRRRTTCFLVKCCHMCKCGCNGRCTLDRLMVACNASINKLQRQTMLGTKRCALIEFRADWPERAERANVKTHQGDVCCTDCKCVKRDMFDNISEFTLTSCPWGERTHDEFLNDTREQLTSVRIHDEATRTLLLDSVHHRLTHPYGRLVRPYVHLEALGIKSGDSLQSYCGDLRDVNSLEVLQLPATVWFFRIYDKTLLNGVTLLWHLPGVFGKRTKHM